MQGYISLPPKFVMRFAIKESRMPLHEVLGQLSQDEPASG